MEADLKVSFLLVAAFLLAAPMLPVARNLNLEVQRHLTRLNKPSRVSIQSPDGDTIDCVDISRQLAFDHPLLKNHTIQRSPSYRPEGGFPFSEGKSTVKKKDVIQLWQRNGRCPEGTIPVRRTKEEDVLRATSIQTYGKKTRKSIPTNASAFPQPNLNAPSEHQHAIATAQGDNYYGTKATINLWSPKVERPEEFSLSQTWIIGGSYTNNDLNTIEAGWQVFPGLYGDYNARLFVYWTSNAYQGTGCYNLLCAGFVQVNNDVAIGGSLQPVSEYGSSQYDLTIQIWKDSKAGNWWMQANDHVLGYWPGTLFTHLSGSASVVQWGGEVLVNLQSGGQHSTTQMGSGHFPDEGLGKASYIKNIQVVDSSNNLQTPKDFRPYAVRPGCYDIKLGMSADWGNYLYYGGPGRNPKCP